MIRSLHHGSVLSFSVKYDGRQPVTYHLTSFTKVTVWLTSLEQLLLINIRSQCNTNHKPNLSKKLIRVKFVLKRLLKIVNLQHYENLLVDYLNRAKDDT